MSSVLQVEQPALEAGRENRYALFCTPLSLTCVSVWKPLGALGGTMNFVIERHPVSLSLTNVPYFVCC